MEDHFDRKISKEEALVKPTRSFRYEDYNIRRVFLRSYPLQWGSPAAGDEKQGQGNAVAAAAGATKNGTGGRGGVEEDEDGYESRDRRWKRQVVVAVVEWGGEKMLLLRRVKKRLTLYLLGCHYGRPALPYKSGGSCTAAMLKSK